MTDNNKTTDVSASSIEIDIPDQPRIVVSGDVVRLPDKRNMVIGPGLIYDNNLARVTKSGVLRCDKKSIWVDRNNRRYDV